ncbi:MAG: DUF1588 domain-containing protein, partial [Polyangiaceae bacterium]|nr:DUF1588 domain-containing protein [Polyangiaceae bacterium]
QLLPLTIISSLLLFSCGTAPLSDGSDSTNEGAENSNDSGEEGSPGNDEERINLSLRCSDSNEAPAALRRLTSKEYVHSILDIFPEIQGEWEGRQLGVDPVGISGFTTDARTLLVGPQRAEEIFKSALEVATLLTNDDHFREILPCADNADLACAEELLSTYGERIYRHVLTTEESVELTTYFESVLQRSDFATAIKWTLVTMLQSPFFVYRDELGDANGELSPEDVATQLAYTFSGTTPSAELFERARAGEFADAEVRVAVAKELLRSARGQEVLMDFLEQWIEFGQVRGDVKDGIENFDAIAEAMVEETRLYLQEVIVEQGGNVYDLLTSPFTFTNATLASHYGYGSQTAEHTYTERPQGQGVGLLAQGSFLAAHAHPAMSSPVFRGLFVFEKLLCGSTPPVPDVVPAIEEAPPANTTRERFENAHGSPGCQACHRSFEPFGFAFESFDAAGRYRSEENGFPINAFAEGISPDGTELTFDGLTELANTLTTLPVMTDCVSGQLAAYAFSGGGGDACLAESERRAFANNEYGLFDYFAALAAAPSMNSRKR